MSRQKDTSRLHRAIYASSQQMRQSLFSLPEIVEIAKRNGITKDVPRLVERMNLNGILLLKPGKKYQLAASSDLLLE
jgi:hypothetical protein